MFQSEPLEAKIRRSIAKIGEWYKAYDNHCYVSFSGGKDSTVLADMCAKWCKEINTTLYLVFVNTGLEYPEIRKHVEFFAQWLRDKRGTEVILEILRPEMRFDEVIKKYGYPIISKEVSQAVAEYRKNPDGCRKARFEGTGRYIKSAYSLKKWAPLAKTDIPVSHKCCYVMKKNPAKKYEKETGRKPIIATMAEESYLRRQKWLISGCNAFGAKRPTSQPMSFWTEQDVLRYLKIYDIPIASVYGDIVCDGANNKLKATGCDRTGCMFCGFGCHLEKPGEGRFERLKETHPRQYEYCIGGGEYDENGKWTPNKRGLGIGHVFDELNKIYGEDFIKYK